MDDANAIRRISSTFVSSPQVGKLMTALAQAQATIKGPAKDAVNPAFRSKYARLEDVLETIRGALAPRGIAFTQSAVDGGEGKVAAWTTLWCGDEFISSYTTMPVGKNDPQGHGSALTYLLRRSALASCGIAPEDDDDGAAASAPVAKAPSDNTAKAPLQASVRGYRPGGGQ